MRRAGRIRPARPLHREHRGRAPRGIEDFYATRRAPSLAMPSRRTGADGESARPRPRRRRLTGPGSRCISTMPFAQADSRLRSIRAIASSSLRRRRADAVGAVAAVELRHVERHVDEADRALPGQVDILRRQRHRRVADRCGHADAVRPCSRSAPSAMAAMMRAAISSSLSALVDGTKTRNSSPPQRTIMSVSRSVSRSRRAMATSTASPAAWPIPVVGLLEEIDVDQKQRVDRLLRLAVARGARTAQGGARA